MGLATSLAIGCATGELDPETSGASAGLTTTATAATTTSGEATTTSGTSGESTSGAATAGGETTTSAEPEPEPEPEPELEPARAVIYQLVVRHFGNDVLTRATNGRIETNGVGKFEDIDAGALAGIRGLGATHVWLTGVLRQATLTDYAALGMPADDPDIVKGIAGSFYAIRDYYDVCPDYAVDPAARLDEFDALVQRVHAEGMGVLIDLVPNHVARSYASVVAPEADFGVADDQGAFFAPGNNYFYLPGQALSLSRPEHYEPEGFVYDGVFPPEDGGPGRAARVTGNNQTSASPAATDWYETIKLNWGFDFTTAEAVYEPVPDTWLKFDAIVAYWQARGVDGFRCDFAHFVPNAAWSWLIERARARDPGVLFVAEAYEDLGGLLAAGFDAVYHDEAYDELKRLYQGKASQSDFAARMGGLDDDARPRYLHYLENHDERRIGSPLVLEGGADDSGFGAIAAGYQLAPLLYLYSAGPVLIYNGQEVGESGAGVEGFGQEDGRTSIFDYWALPELVKWRNGGAYDGGGLSEAQRALRRFYADLLALAQDPSAAAIGYWGLEYWNNPAVFPDCPYGFYSFARYEPGSGRALVVVANFTPGAAAAGTIRLPEALIDAIGLGGEVAVRRVLDEGGAANEVIAALPAGELESAGFSVTIPDQRAHVFAVEGSR